MPSQSDFHGFMNLREPTGISAAEKQHFLKAEPYCEERASGLELIAWWVVALVGSWAALFGISWALFKIATFVRVTL